VLSFGLGHDVFDIKAFPVAQILELQNWVMETVFSFATDTASLSVRDRD
jgi:hypothetical protein